MRKEKGAMEKVDVVLLHMYVQYTYISISLNGNRHQDYI